MLAKMLHPGLIRDPDASATRYWITVIIFNISGGYFGWKLGTMLSETVYTAEEGTAERLYRQMQEDAQQATNEMHDLLFEQTRQMFMVESLTNEEWSAYDERLRTAKDMGALLQISSELTAREHLNN